MAEAYPWRRVLFGCMLVFACWGIGLYREYPAEVDEYVRRVQDWTYAKAWAHLGEFSAARIAPVRAPLWAQVQGPRVLELGIGHGESLRLLNAPQAGIRIHVALEPNPYMHQQLVQSARRAGFAVRFNEVSEKLAERQLIVVNDTLAGGVPGVVAAAAPYNSVVTSLSLCLADDLDGTLRAIFDLLSPGGRFIFVERAGRIKQAWAQRVVGPLLGNCQLDRGIAQAIRGMRWRSVDVSTGGLPGSFLDRLTPLVHGVAVK